MKTRYIDLIEQTFDFPQEDFSRGNNGLEFHKIPLMDLIEEHGTPLKFTYLPKITDNISRCRKWFTDAMKKVDYKGEYHYCYVSKSSHFLHVIQRALESKVYLETSSAFDMALMESLHEKGLIKKDQTILCNGYKTEDYARRMARLMDKGFTNIISVVDNFDELDRLKAHTKSKLRVGIRIASEEEPKFEFYTSRLGIGYKDIMRFYKEKIKNDPQVDLEMMHFFINTGINDNSYYWNELVKCLRIFTDVAKECDTLRALNIGGGFPIKNSLSFDYDYAYMAEEIISQIKTFCNDEGLEEPDVYTEFGSFTVGESGGVLFKILSQKRQNDRERWNMIDGSFMTTLPDTWAISKRFVMLPVNRWEDQYERVFLGGITCDSDDYYNAEQHVNAIYLPKYDPDKTLYIGFFNTGAYQDTLGGTGGIHHCLIPEPKHLLIDRDENGELNYRVFREAQKDTNMLEILGY